MLPVALVLLAIIALALYILFGYFIPPLTEPVYPKRAGIAIVVVIIVLLLWFVLPVHVGP
jgi:hypothetical protein